MYSPPDKSIWTGRIDRIEGESGLRWHQIIGFCDLSIEQLPKLASGEKGVVVIGFMSDEGVRRNKGRAGAKDGPDALRRACCNHANHLGESLKIIDAGNVVCERQDLEKAQEELRPIVSQVISSGYFPFIFGGGHEVAFPHFIGLSNAISNDKLIGIINIDAHFDLRIPEEQASSGTPFYQISNACKKINRTFRYFCVGIEESSNSQVLFKRADELGSQYILNRDLNDRTATQLPKKLKRFIEDSDLIYLTICLDVFDIAFAPGVSAPTAIGLRPDIALKLIREILSAGKLVSADIAELNPSLDQNEMTAKLAAKLAYNIITKD